MSELSLIASRLPGAPGAINAQAITATVPDPPRNFMSLDNGTILRGTVQGRDKDGLITINTDRGQIKISTNANLPPGAGVTLEVRSVGDRLQVVLLAVDPVSQQPSNLPGSTGSPQAGQNTADGRHDISATGAAHDPATRSVNQITGDREAQSPTVIVAGTRLTAIVIQSLPRDLLQNVSPTAPQAAGSIQSQTAQNAANSAPPPAAATVNPSGASAFSADFRQTQQPPISASLIPEIHDRITALFSQPIGDVGTQPDAPPLPVTGLVLSPEIRERILALFVGPSAAGEAPASASDAALSQIPSIAGTNGQGTPPAPTAAARPILPGQQTLRLPSSATDGAIPATASQAPLEAPLPAGPAVQPPSIAQPPSASPAAVSILPGPSIAAGPAQPFGGNAGIPAPPASGAITPQAGPLPPAKPDVHAAEQNRQLPAAALPLDGLALQTSAAQPLPASANSPVSSPGGLPQGSGGPVPGGIAAGPLASGFNRPSLAPSIPQPPFVSAPEAELNNAQGSRATGSALPLSTPGGPVPNRPSESLLPAPVVGQKASPQQPIVQAPSNQPASQTAFVSPSSPTTSLPIPALATATANTGVPNTGAPGAAAPTVVPQVIDRSVPILPPSALGGSPLATNPQVLLAALAVAPGNAPLTDTMLPPVSPLPQGAQQDAQRPSTAQTSTIGNQPLPSASPQIPAPSGSSSNSVMPEQVTATPLPQAQPPSVEASGIPSSILPIPAPVTVPTIAGFPSPTLPQVSAELLAQLVAETPEAVNVGHLTLPGQTAPGTGNVTNSTLPPLTGEAAEISGSTYLPQLPSGVPFGQVTGVPQTPAASPVLGLPQPTTWNNAPTNPFAVAPAAPQDPAVSPSPISPIVLNPLLTNLTTAGDADASRQASAKTGATEITTTTKTTDTGSTAATSAVENKQSGIAVTAVVASLGKAGLGTAGLGTTGLGGTALAAANAEYLATNLAVSAASDNSLAKLDLTGKEQMTGPLPTGTEVRLRVLNIQTQPGATLNPGAVSPGAGLGNKAAIIGQILGHTPAGHPVIHTALGDLVLQQQATLPVGGEITLALEAVEMAASASGLALPLTPQMTAMSLAQGWPTLLDLLVTLQRGLAAGTEATGSTGDTADPAAMAHLPQAGSKLAAGLNAAVDAFRSGDFEKLFGPLTSALKSTGTKQEAIRKLRDEFGQLSMLAQDRPNQDWKCFMLPVWDDGRLQQINLFYRRPRRGQTGKDKNEDATRFVVDVNFTRLGGCQLDGLIRKKNFDLMVRSHRELPLSVKRDIAGLFAQARDIGNYAGEVSFQMAIRFPVSPLDDIAEGPPSVTA